jgi:ATP-dependent Clp protease ATP-binding subunit ClpA
MVKIVDRLIKETNELLDENDKSVTVLLDDMARTELADQGYEPAMGARPLKRVFENKIKKPLSKKLLFEDISNTSIMITWNGSEFDFNVQ